ncbi:hypothetical protein INQ51_04825 [Maribellus sp. CM-23]|uniref:hypothetical protein n=1 Tax=Maribellus sp. CM-23 TaxID=2781026 RepID=UPI001F3F3DC5|nr:hypothetical protein [Maribellus sp. CM-23]MCE4563625.1 hypothetical protein [Maribellus sp. CM-23]
MSRIRKKKKTNCNRKQLEAEKRNHFLRHIQHIFIESGCGQVYRVLTPTVMQALYSIKDSSLKIRQGNCSCLSNSDIKLLKQTIDKEAQQTKVTIKKGDYTMSIKEFYTYGLSLHVLQTWLAEQEEPEMQEAYTLMKERLDIVQAETDFRSHLFAFCSTFSMMASELNKFQSHVKPQIISDNSGRIKGLEFELNAYPCEQKKFRIDGHTRPAFRVGSYAYYMIHPEWVSVKRSLFEKPTAFNNIDIPVYIQTHAINRLRERIDTLSRDCVELYVYLSFQNPVITFFRGKILVDYVYAQTKLGYLLVEIADNVLLIKTFLLLTNQATPEGEKLKDLTGLSKIDMKYWNIDRLSTFQKTDMEENEELQLIFRNAGCSGLFSKAVNFLEEEEKEHRSIADNFLKYCLIE